MDGIGEFANQNTHLASLPLFVNGLALFALGLVTGLEARRPGESIFTRNLWLLAVYALLASLASWARMPLLREDWTSPSAVGIPLLALRASSIVLGSLFLLWFAAALGRAALPGSRRWFQWLPALIVLVWLTSFLNGLFTNSVGAAAWLDEVNALVRRFLHSPALALAGLSILFYRPQLSTGDLTRRLAHASNGAAVAFGLRSVLVGLVSFLPARAPDVILGLASQHTVLILGVEILLTVCTIAVAFFVIRVLACLEDERSHQLDTAVEQRLQAQRAVLETERFSRETIEHWSDRLESVSDAMADAIHDPRKLSDALTRTLSDILAWTGFDAGQVLFKVQDGSRLVQAAQRCLCTSRCCDACEMSEQKLSGHSLSQAMVRYPVRDGGDGADRTDTPEWQTLLTIPIKHRGEALGIAALGGMQRVEVSSSQLTLLESLGQQIGVAVEYSRVHARISSAAVKRERTRLSREMHDSMLQDLDLLYLRLTTLEELLQEGNVPRALSEAHRALDVCSIACDEARQTILGLRFTANSRGSLIAELRGYADRIAKHSQIKVSVRADGCRELNLPRDTEVQLLGIIHEALSNVRRHAEATWACVELTCVNDVVTVTIADDGKGFDKEWVEQDSQYHFGLQTMAERAASVGGTLAIDSAPGRGTRLIASLPTATR